MMKIPFFEEIHLNQACNVDYIKEKLLEIKIGEIPILVRTEKISEKDFLETLPEIEKAVLDLKIDPHLPYPIIIFSNYISTHPFFTIVNKEEEIPKYFYQKNKRLSKKEIQALMKINMAREKFINLYAKELLLEIKKATNDQRRLYDLSKELFFYEELIKKMPKGTEKKNEFKKR